MFAQTERFTFGVTGGVPFGRVTSSNPYGPDESKRYTVGLSFDAWLNEHVSLNFTPLYKRTGARYGIVPNTYINIGADTQRIYENYGQVRGHSLELPVIGKYTFRPASKTWRPFFGAGFAFQTAFETVENRVVVRDANGGNQQTIDAKYDRRTPWDVGAVAATGLSIRHGRIEYLPELRVTRWGNPNTGHGRTQGQFLFSIRF